MCEALSFPGAGDSAVSPCGVYNLVRKTDEGTNKYTAKHRAAIKAVNTMWATVIRRSCFRGAVRATCVQRLERRTLPARNQHVLSPEVGAALTVGDEEEAGGHSVVARAGE